MALPTRDVVRPHADVAQVQTLPKMSEKPQSTEHLDDVAEVEANLVYDETDEEPELHLRTYLALAAMFLLNLVQVFALQGPPAVLSFIGRDLKNTTAETWIPNSLALAQAVIAPIISSTSDTFQARKLLLVGLPVVSCIGSAIAPGSSSIYRLIGAQILIGFGFSTTPLAYCVPSEILPRRWRPMAQALVNVAPALGAATAPLVIGALTQRNPHTGWRYFYWIQMVLWALTAILTFVGYRPPPRHTRYDHLSLLHKVKRLDLPGMALLAAGLTLLLTGLNLGGGLYKWTDAAVLAPIIVGAMILVTFGVYETKFTKTGILHHDLFRGGKERGRTFALCLLLVSIEGLLLVAYAIFYPILTNTLFEPDPFLSAARGQPFWIIGGLSTIAYGYASTKMRTLRSPLVVGFVLLTGGMIGFATIQPGDSVNAMVFSGLSGLGFGSPLILVVAGVHLSTPHDFIATATAIATSSRAVFTAVFTAVYAATFSSRLQQYTISSVGAAAVSADLPTTSIPGFIAALASNDAAALQQIPGVTPAIVQAGVVALKQAFANAIRLVFVIAVPFGILACIASLFIPDLKASMTYRVDAPVEVLHAKHHRVAQEHEA